MKNKQMYDAIHNHIGQGRVFSKEEENELLEKLARGERPVKRRKWFPEMLGWSLAGVALILVVVFIGSQTDLLPFTADHQPERLDTSLLKETEIQGLEDMPEEEKEHVLNNSPKSYEADSTEDALKALPFKLKLPKNLPFEGKFVVTDINDWHFESNTDGKDISVDFIAGNNAAGESSEVIMIGASDFIKETVGSGSQPDTRSDVQLNKGISGAIDVTETGGRVKFVNKSGVEIDIAFHHEIDKYDTREVLIDLANQMIE